MMKAIVLSPHTDDGELGCGGTIARLVSQGAELTYLAFSAGKREVLRDETARALTVLGVSSYQILDFEIRKFLHYRQEILQILYDYNKSNRVDLVLTPSRIDLHQDHQVVTQEVMRAFKTCTILGYELPWNNIAFTTNYFVRLEKEDVEKKIKSLKCYDTQKDKYYFNEDFLRGLLKVRGTQIQTDCAEAFEAIRVVC
ncbi:MAG: PIG-L family deacetylase [Dehalococcoidia bacterium]|nr:PIG-L family deacetylase [Dehalococcoidia bacterium]